MKIQVRSIHPNPYRNFERNPLIQERTDQLVASINSTEFWDNVVVRENPVGSGYQLAYGHHRLEALKVSGIKTVDIPCKNLTDAVMVKMMADENLMQWGNSPAATLEAVEAARDLLESGLKVCETPEEFAAYGAIRSDSTVQSYAKLRKSGTVGTHIIRAFLGKGWSTNVINDALKVINYNRDLEKAELEEAAAKEAEVAAQKLQREEEAKRRAEEAKVAAEAEKIAKAKAAQAAADTKHQREAAAKQQRAAETRRKEAEKRQAEADKAAQKAAAEADRKRKAAAAAHSAKHKVASRPNRETFEGFKTQEQASKFATESAKYPMTAVERVRCGSYIINNGFSSRQISAAIISWVKIYTEAGRKAALKEKQQAAEIKGTTLDDLIGKINATTPDYAKLLASVEPYIDQIEDPRLASMFERRITKELAPVVNKLVRKLNALASINETVN